MKPFSEFKSSDFDAAYAALGTNGHLKDELSQTILDPDGEDFKLTAAQVRATGEGLARIVNYRLRLNEFSETDFVVPREFFVRDALVNIHDLAPADLTDEWLLEGKTPEELPPVDHILSFQPEVKSYNTLADHMDLKIDPLTGEIERFKKRDKYVDAVLDEIWKRAVRQVKEEIGPENLQLYAVQQLSAKGVAINYLPEVTFEIRKPRKLDEAFSNLEPRPGE